MWYNYSITQGEKGNKMDFETNKTSDVEIYDENEQISSNDAENEIRKEENRVIKKLTENMWNNDETTAASIRKIQHFAELGNGYACYQLAKYFLFHDQNYESAVPYIKMGSDAGSQSCSAVLGKAFEKGLGVEKDYEKAWLIYETLAKQGNVFASYALADMMFYGKGCKEDKTAAFELFLDLAEKGYPKAKHKVGLMYQKGTGVEMDNQQAIYWYSSAVNDHYQKAYTSLGAMYYAGIGVESDMKMACKLFMEGAKNRDKISCYYLGKCCYKGLGIEQDKRRGIKLLIKADKKGDIKAKGYLENVVGYFESEQLESQSIKDFYQNQMIA